MQAKRDENFVPTLIGVSSVDLKTPITAAVDPTTHRLLVDAIGFTGSVQTDVFISSNGQTSFTASQSVATTLFLSLNGSVQNPSADYSVAASIATLSNVRYPVGVPAGTEVVWVYIIA